MKGKREREVRGDPKPKTGEYLPGHTKSVAKSDTASFGSQQTDWDASTLPLSYTR